ncbi:sulfatase-like hydrolase/transferase [Vallitalea sp.]|jgi:arylsulfatase A-like enzyme|uniref:sulfatase-like hydrolase/transferase n=1 Tax=Vallitalea sp. TaxID=1882829 RepID=UPI0025E35FFF|nr:sulfatase-like hydrolase/transferase [Vallitalea sp.]MCT4688829.1 sulfatase-like hydrolase/transferase [Vallitalea sp.]
MNKNKNLIFIMTDHQRADSIFMVQDGKEVTPNLNKLAKESVKFNRAYTTCPLCVPARTALATGKHPTANGVVLNKGSEPTDTKPIHQYLKESGYQVGHVGIDHIRVKPTLKDRVNFDFWIDDDDYFAYAKNKGIDTTRSNEDVCEIMENHNGNRVKKAYSNARVSKWKYEDNNHKDAFFCSKALEFLDNIDDDKPFALFVYLWAPHPPLFVPNAHYQLFNPNNITLPNNIGKISLNESETRKYGAPRQLAESVDSDYWKEVWSAHLGLVNYADNIIGKILDKANEIDRNSDTIKLFTVDHGEHLGQHNMYQKMEMYEQAVNIPLIINVPNSKPREIEEIVSHIDILPTILDLLNIEYGDLDGKTLRGVFEGEKLPSDNMVFSQYSGNQPVIGDIRRAVITDKYKYVYDEIGTQELYDLKNDSMEMENIAGNALVKDVVSDLYKNCKEFFIAHNDWIKYE